MSNVIEFRPRKDPREDRYRYLLGDTMSAGSPLKSRQRLIVIYLAFAGIDRPIDLGASIDTLAKKCSMSCKTVLKHAKIAQSLGYVKIENLDLPGYPSVPYVVLIDPKERHAVSGGRS